MKLKLSLLMGIALLGTPSYGAILFGLVPSDGVVAGPPGSLVGWGYSLTNDSLTDWFLTVNLNADSFANGTPAVLFDFPVVGPGATIAVPFDPLAATGLYQLTWDAGAPDGFVNSGNFVLSGQWWDGDPFNGGSFLFDEPDINLPYSATVTGSSDIPEPSASLLVVVALAVLALFKKCSLFKNRSALPALEP